jgi:hypothetical protein
MTQSQRGTNLTIANRDNLDVSRPFCPERYRRRVRQINRLDPSFSSDTAPANLQKAQAGTARKV